LKTEVAIQSFPTRYLIGALLISAVIWDLMGCEYNQVRLDTPTRDSLKGQREIMVAHDPTFRLWAFDNPRCQYVRGRRFVPPSCRDSREPATYRSAPGEIKVEDPILKIQRRVVSLLQTNLGLQKLRINPDPINAVTFSGINTDLTLLLKNDTLTLTNKNRGNPTNPDNVMYSIAYEATGQLILRKDFKILWQDRCSIDTLDAGIPRMSFGDLKADNWALLDEVLTTIANRCAEQMLGSFFR
jgi:hypothetical protein